MAAFDTPFALALNPTQVAQLRDLMRCVSWIRDIQLNETAKTFDLREFFADVNRAYCAHQQDVACELFKQLDDYCKANQIPPMQWKMK